MSDFDLSLIPNEVLHEAAVEVLHPHQLTGGHGNNPYNFRCPICGDSKKHSLKKRGYVLFDKGQWTYVCHNECGTMSFLSFLKTFHPDVYRRVIFHGFAKRGRKKPVVELPKTNGYKSQAVYNFKEGELLSVFDEHPMAKVALSYCEKRKIPHEVYSKWFVCIEGDQFINRDSMGAVIRNDRGMPTGNEYKNRLIIPYYRFGGGWMQFDARSFDKDCLMKYRNLEGVDREMYKIDWIDTSRPFFLLEGAIDATFIRNSVSFGGTKHLMSFLEQHPQLKQNAHNGTVLWDNDNAGRDEINKTVRLGFSWFDWSSIKALPEHSVKEDGSYREIKDVNDMVLYTDAITVDEEGFVVIDSLKKYIRKADGGILATMLYGNRDKMRKQNVKERFEEMALKRKPKELRLFTESI